MSVRIISKSEREAMLINAVQNGSLDDFKQLIEWFGIVANKTNIDWMEGSSVIHSALEHNRLDIIGFMLSRFIIRPDRLSRLAQRKGCDVRQIIRNAPIAPMSLQMSY